MEDRQYQLDVSNLGLFTASWRDITRVTEEEKRNTDPEIVASQNPALEWNTSPPKQDESIVHMNPVVQEFSICCIAAPAITVNRSNADKSSSKPVIVCGHSVEANIASDLCLYLSLGNITMAQNLSARNFGALTDCFPFQTRGEEPSQPPPRHTKHRHSRADSGFDSDVSHRSHDYQPDIFRPPSTTMDFPPARVAKVTKQKYKTLSIKQPTKTSSQARKIIPFDLLLTGREISIFLYSHGENKDEVCPFLFSELSQPSFAASVSKRKTETRAVAV
ncbi:putative vacuolar protein sorting-associated protein 13B-like [Apostichopus japonicus]|uniref:Putative vacuolar protein sorting-associated protein 13B-like n=1 Tax=Stichopus japonicus TaxID=307972 RepID=A0A2G8K7I8_STIJA|nr:putative vacuolar protein sorting-associated protein 13B-like [Apostichopus japonicus]